MASSISEAQAELIRCASSLPHCAPSFEVVGDDLTNVVCSSFGPDDIPIKLRCAICSKLAVNAFRLPCCEQAICESCMSTLQDDSSVHSIRPIMANNDAGQQNLPSSCPVCEHSPLSAEDCNPNKSLRTTIKVFLRTAEKKKEALRAKEAKEATPATPVEPTPASTDPPAPEGPSHDQPKHEEDAGREAQAAGQQSDQNEQEETAQLADQVCWKMYTQPRVISVLTCHNKDQGRRRGWAG